MFLFHELAVQFIKQKTKYGLGLIGPLFENGAPQREAVGTFHVCPKVYPTDMTHLLINFAQYGVVWIVLNPLHAVMKTSRDTHFRILFVACDLCLLIFPLKLEARIVKKGLMKTLKQAIRFVRTIHFLIKTLTFLFFSGSRVLGIVLP